MKCPACSEDTLEHQIDRATKRPVRDGGRYLMRCTTCGHMPVLDAADLRELKGKRAWLWWLPTAAGALVTVAEILRYLLVRNLEQTDTISPLAIYLFGATAATALLSAILYCIAGFVHGRDPRERANFAIVMVLFIAALCAGCWMAWTVWKQELASSHHSVEELMVVPSTARAFTAPLSPRSHSAASAPNFRPWADAACAGRAWAQSDDTPSAPAADTPPRCAAIRLTVCSSLPSWHSLI